MRECAARQSQAAAPPPAVGAVAVQLTLDLDDAPGGAAPSGLPEMTGAERVRAELEVLGLDASRHVLDFYAPFLDRLGVTRARDLLGCRSRAAVLVAGVKVATQTPPVRSGRRVVFVTLDDATGPVDATFFEDAQVGYASTLFHSWLLVLRGVIRRTGPRGISLRALGCWELPGLQEVWETGGMAAVETVLARPPGLLTAVDSDAAVLGAAASRSTRPVNAPLGEPFADPMVVASGYTISPYADVRPAGGRPFPAGPSRKLWHASTGSSGR